MRILLFLGVIFFASTAYSQQGWVPYKSRQVFTDTLYAPIQTPYVTNYYYGMPTPVYIPYYAPLPESKITIRYGLLGRQKTVIYKPYVGYINFGPFTWSQSQRYGY
tara:strand:+ start:106 stop:423 length:318 start_codon:yes stop_codon:yes gene_type:complete